MKCHYYPETDSLYIDLADKPGAEVREVAPGVLLDFDENGQLVGIDIDHATSLADLSTMDIRALPLTSLTMAATGAAEVPVGK